MKKTKGISFGLFSVKKKVLKVLNIVLQQIGLLWVLEFMKPEELKIELEQNPTIVLIDVREPYEYDICKISTALLLPMSQFVQHVNIIPKNKDLVVYCHHGVRSAMVVRFLLQNGYNRVKNLEGGIDQWAIKVDATLQRY